MKEFEREKKERENWERGTDVRVNEREKEKEESENGELKARKNGRSGGPKGPGKLEYMM